MRVVCVSSLQFENLVPSPTSLRSLISSVDSEVNGIETQLKKAKDTERKVYIYTTHEILYDYID